VALFPLFVELAGSPCVVLGGGAVAERKVAGLLEAGAVVTVVSPSLTPALAALVSAGRIAHIARGYAPGDLAGSRLAFAATDDGIINAAVADEGRERGVWVNAADDPAHCDFILPSIFRRGDLTVAVATGGTAPALARAIREDLEHQLGDHYTVLGEVVAEVRRELRASGRTPDAAAWHRALDGSLRDLVARGRRAEARRHLLARLRIA
jgi:siroheme synthase-like protein